MKDVAGRARAVRICFWLLIAIYGAAGLSDLTLVAFLVDLRAGAAPDPVYADQLDARQAAFGMLQIAILIACAVAFCAWFAQAHRNLGGAGLQGLKYSPGWAVGGFFVPFLNLVRPYQVMKEVWSGAVALERDAPAEWAAVEAPPLVSGWWALFLISSFLDSASGRLLMRAEELDELIAAASLLALSDFFNLPAAFIAMRLVARLTALQERARMQALARGIGSFGPPS